MKKPPYGSYVIRGKGGKAHRAYGPVAEGWTTGCGRQIPLAGSRGHIAQYREPIPEDPCKLCWAGLIQEQEISHGRR